MLDTWIQWVQGNRCHSHYRADCCVLSSSVCSVLCCFRCVWLSNPMDYGPPGSSVHGIFPERILEWVGISFSRGSLKPGIKSLSSASPVDSLPLSHRGSLILSLPATKCYSPLHTSWIRFPAILPPPSANPNVPPTYFTECWTGIAQHEPLTFCLMGGEMETLAGKEDGSGWLDSTSACDMHTISFFIVLCH